MLPRAIRANIVKIKKASVTAVLNVVVSNAYGCSGVGQLKYGDSEWNQVA
jgi:hypothetical protein